MEDGGLRLLVFNHALDCGRGRANAVVAIVTIGTRSTTRRSVESSALRVSMADRYQRSLAGMCTARHTRGYVVDDYILLLIIYTIF